MSEFTSPEAWTEAAFRDAAFFNITSFDTSGGKRKLRKGTTENWTEAHKCGIVLGMLNRTCTIYVVTKQGHSAFLPPSCWDALDRIWSEIREHNTEGSKTDDKSGL